MVKLYIFVGVYDGIADEISLHLTEEAAEAAYTKYTGVPYVNPLTDQSNADPNTVTEPEISEHVNASTIERCGSRLRARLVPRPRLLGSQLFKVREHERVHRIRIQGHEAAVQHGGEAWAREATA